MSLCWLFTYWVTIIIHYKTIVHATNYIAPETISQESAQNTAIAVSCIENMCNLYWCSLAMSLSILRANMVIWSTVKHTPWSMHNIKYKTHPEGEKIRCQAFSSSIFLRTHDL